jgi:hypothetical protein
MTGDKAEESKQGDTATVPSGSDESTAAHSNITFGVHVADSAEARALKTIRIVVLCILAIVAGGTGFFSFSAKREEERESFEVQASGSNEKVTWNSCSRFLWSDIVAPRLLTLPLPVIFLSCSITVIHSD